MLNKELTNFAEHNKNDNQIAEYIFNTYLGKSLDLIKITTWLDKNNHFIFFFFLCCSTDKNDSDDHMPAMKNEASYSSSTNIPAINLPHSITNRVQSLVFKPGHDEDEDLNDLIKTEVRLKQRRNYIWSQI